LELVSVFIISNYTVFGENMLLAKSVVYF